VDKNVPEGTVTRNGENVKRKALKWLKVTSTSPDSKAVQTRANKIITILSYFHRKSF